MTKKILSFALLILIAMPNLSSASHRNNVDTSDLDDDPVEDLYVPVLFGVSPDEIRSDFGEPRGGGTRSHEGQDMFAPEGTPIVSPTEAVVLSTGEGASAGKFVYTANPGGEVFRYMHLQEIASIERGDELDPGDLVGLMGDTGNAAPGDYHLHFEIRDEDNDALDPYPRLTKEFTLKKKVSFLKDILRNFKRSDRDEYAAFLVDTFGPDFIEANNKEYNLPSEIEDAMEEGGVFGAAKLLVQLQQLVATIPSILNREVKLGDSGAAVTLLQFYLMYSEGGEAKLRLVRAGATGYFGPITEAALREYQAANDLAVSGVYNAKTRTEFIELAK